MVSCQNGLPTRTGRPDNALIMSEIEAKAVGLLPARDRSSSWLTVRSMAHLSANVPNRASSAAISSISSAGRETTNLNATLLSPAKARSAAGTIRLGSGTSEPDSFGEIVNRSIAATRSSAGTTVPFVSISTRRPARWSSATSGTSRRCWSSDSPPVTTTRSAGWASSQSTSARARIASLCSDRSNRRQSHVWGSSQNEQVRLHPDSRRKTARWPAVTPSP